MRQRYFKGCPDKFVVTTYNLVDQKLNPHCPTERVEGRERDW